MHRSQRVEPAVEVSPTLTHIRHDGLPVTLLKVPGSQSVHELAPPVLYFPAGHSLLTLVPSHVDPAGHEVQLVRVVLVPPEVNEPTVHGSQVVAWFALHKSSAPQTSQPPLSESFVPARQNMHCVAPASDVEPSSHTVQLDAPGSGE